MSFSQCTNYVITITPGQWPSEVSWSFTQGGTTYAAGGAPASVTLCLNNGTYSFNMFDSWGDGWNNATWTIVCANGTTVASGTLASGFSASQNIILSSTSCATPTCPPGQTLYNFAVTPGGWPSEISWNITLDGVEVLSGAAPYTGTICMSTGCYLLNMYDSFGDGWNGSTYTLSLGASVVYSGTLANGGGGFATFSIGGGDCTDYIPVTASDCLDAVDVCENLTFAIDPNGWGAVWEIPALGSLGNPWYTAGDGANSPWGSDNFGCLQNEELNSTWMVVNIWGSGTLEFTFGGLGTQAGYYDWIMYPYNGVTTCQDIYYNLLPPVRCNWNDVPFGGTGLASAIPPGGDPNNFEPALWVNAGEQYIICFSNWSSVSTVVPLDFGGTAVVSCLNVMLPVEMISFEAAYEVGIVELKWTTVSELNNECFYIEKSADGITWSDIALVPGQGTTSEMINYSHFDSKPFNGWNYYRLRQQDFNGMFRKSEVVDVFVRSASISAFPNPSTGVFVVQIQAAGHSNDIRIKNHLGMNVQFDAKKLGEQSSVFEISLVHPVPGVYHVGHKELPGSSVKVIVN